MPQTAIRVYRKLSGETPLTEWLDGLQQRNRRAYAKCLQRIANLAELGNELRRPLADKLRDNIFELRAKVGRVNYRILYFFCGHNMACLSHGFTKEGAVPQSEIDDAVKRRKLVLRDRERHTAEFEV